MNPSLTGRLHRLDLREKVDKDGGDGLKVGVGLVGHLTQLLCDAVNVHVTLDGHVWRPLQVQAWCEAGCRLHQPEISTKTSSKKILRFSFLASLGDVNKKKK
jgi:hypothetical protein